jgi:hypothetical protein
MTAEKTAVFWNVDEGEGAPVEGSEALVKYMPGEDGEQPFVLLAEHPTGARVKPHKHQNGRLEYIIDGEIEFFEGADALAFWRGEPVEGTRHGPGSVSYVPGGTLYAYRITKASKLLHVHQSHGGNDTVHYD